MGYCINVILIFITPNTRGNICKTIYMWMVENLCHFFLFYRVYSGFQTNTSLIVRYFHRLTLVYIGQIMKPTKNTFC